jgi:maleate isomerase
LTASIGLVLPFDSALDREYWRYVPDDVDLYLGRTEHIAGPLGVPLIMAVSEPDRVLPVVDDMVTALDPDVVVYGCTSGSFLRGLSGSEDLRIRMEELGCHSAGSTSEFLLDALRALAATKVAVAAPYDDEMTGLLVDYLESAGFEVASTRNLGMTGDPKTVPESEVLDLALAADHPEADVLFLSCTNLRTFDLVAELEDRLGKPVLTANQVTIWGALRRLGLSNPKINQVIFRRM